ncbi:MAG: RNA polymerase sigma factor [Firmicutes bacterium]|nr:RNA polymerase sigma factor [Bacillota bacterium]
MVNNREFNTLAEKYMDMIFRLAYSNLRSQSDADDVTQNVLLALYRSKKEFESEAHVKNWLAKVTVNECRRIWRMPWAKHENIDDYESSLKFEDQSHRELFEAVMRLDKNKRTAVVLHYIEGYSLKEIAQLTGVPVGTVGTRLSRAREELKGFLTEGEKEI